MNYAINDSCVFTPEERDLRSLHKPVAPVYLSKHASKALLTLVVSPQEVVSRERLFSIIWADDASFASNASLNNYISEIRKAFALFDECDVIETIPRLGFKFTGVVKHIADNPGQDGINFAHTPSTKKVNKHFIYTYSRFLSFLFLSLAAAGTYFYLAKDTLDKDFLFTLDKCDVYLVTWSNDERESEIIIKKEIEKEGVNCKSSLRDVFFSEGKRYNHAYKTQMITVCDKIAKGEYADCINFKNEVR